MLVKGAPGGNSETHHYASVSCPHTQRNFLHWFHYHTFSYPQHGDYTTTGQQRPVG